MLNTLAGPNHDPWDRGMRSNTEAAMLEFSSNPVWKHEWCDKQPLNRRELPHNIESSTVDDEFVTTLLRGGSVSTDKPRKVNQLRALGLGDRTVAGRRAGMAVLRRLAFGLCQPLPHTATHYHTLPHTKQIMKISLPKDNRTFSRYISSNVCHRPTEKTLIDVGPSCTQQERNAAVWWGSCRPVRRVRTYSKHAVVDLHLYTTDSQ